MCYSRASVCVFYREYTIQLPNFAEYAVLTNRIRKDLNIDEIQIFLRGSRVSRSYNAAERLRFD